MSSKKKVLIITPNTEKQIERGKRQAKILRDILDEEDPLEQQLKHLPSHKKLKDFLDKQQKYNGELNVGEIENNKLGKSGAGLGMSKAPTYNATLQTNKDFLTYKQGGAVKSNNKVVSIHFSPNSVYDTSIKRLKYIRDMGLEPLKRVHNTPTGWAKYRIVKYNQNKDHYTIKRNGGVNLIMEK